MALNNLGLGFIFTAKDLASGVMQKVKGSFGEVEGAAGGMGGVVKDSFKSFGTGLAIAGAGLAGLAMLEPAVEESTKLGKAIALIATETTEAQFPQEKMLGITEQLAVQFGKLPVEQAQAMYKAVALGANDAAKATAFLTGVNKLAIAGDADLITTTNALGGVLNAYGESFNKADDYAGAFFVAMRQGNTTIQDLASSIGRLAPLAKSLNVPFDEVAGAVSVMTNKGIQASEAVSGLKEAFANIVHPTSDAQKEAARLGIKFDQATLRAKGFKGFLDSITSSSKFTNESFSKLFTSVEGASAIINVTSNGLKDYAGVLDGMKDKSSAVNDGLAIMQQTLSYQEDRFKANKAVILGMIGKAIEPLIATTLRFTNTVLEGFAKIPKPIVAFMTKAFLAASVMLTLVGGVIAAKAAIVLMIAGLKAAGVTIGGLILTMAPAIAILGLLAIAFAGLKIAYEKNLGGFATFVDGTIAKVKLAFDGLAQIFTDGGFSGAVLKELNKAENQGIKDFAITVFLWVNRIKNFFAGIFDGFSSGIDAAKPAIQEFIAGFQRLAVALDKVFVQYNPTANGRAWASFGATGAGAGRMFAKAFEVVIQILTKAVEVATFFADNWEDVSAVVGFAARTVGAVFGLMADIVGGVFGFLQSQIGGLIDAVHGMVMIIAGLLQGDMGEAWRGLKLLVFGVIDGIIGSVLSLVSIVAGAVDRILGMFGKESNLSSGIKDFRNHLHTEMAKETGVSDLTSVRHANGYGGESLGGPQKAGIGAGPAELAPLIQTPLAASAYAPTAYSPALAALGPGPGHEGPGFGGDMGGHLKKIADNTAQAPVLNVYLDGDKLPVRKSGARDFTPIPTPT